jgi:hypothetical protein
MAYPQFVGYCCPSAAQRGKWPVEIPPEPNFHVVIDGNRPKSDGIRKSGIADTFALRCRNCAIIVLIRELSILFSDPVDHLNSGDRRGLTRARTVDLTFAICILLGGHANALPPEPCFLAQCLMLIVE